MKLRSYAYVVIKLMLILLIASDLHLVFGENLQKSKELSNTSLKPKVDKVLFMYKYRALQFNENHKMNQFTFKNLLFTDDQITVFTSVNENIEAPDGQIDLTKYTFTIRYEYLDLPCFNKAFICTHDRFVKEYKEHFKEYDFTIPQEIIKYFAGDYATASTNCLITFLHPSKDVRNAAWICHPNIKIILDLGQRISIRVKESFEKDYSFMATYVQEQSSMILGRVELKKERYIFKDETENVVMNLEWSEMYTYVHPLFLKDKIQWKGKEGPPEDDRCYKLMRKSEFPKNNPDYFCIYYERNDLSQKKVLPLPEARFLVEMTTAKINLRYQEYMLKASLKTLATFKSPEDGIPSQLLDPLKDKVRSKYLIQKEIFNIERKIGNITPNQMENFLQKEKVKIIHNACESLDICEKAVNVLIDKRILPLEENGYHISADLENPYNMYAPNEQLKIDVKESVGKKIVAAVAKVEGVSSFFATMLPEASFGGIPNMPLIVKAFNTFKSFRGRANVEKIEELAKSCRVGGKNEFKNIRRKISFLSYESDEDLFFNYFAHIRNYQAGLEK